MQRGQDVETLAIYLTSQCNHLLFFETVRIIVSISLSSKELEN